MQMLNFNEIMKKVILFVAIFAIACVSAHAQNYSNRNAAKAIVDAIEESNGTCYDRDSNGNIYKGTLKRQSQEVVSSSEQSYSNTSNSGSWSAEGEVSTDRIGASGRYNSGNSSSTNNKSSDKQTKTTYICVPNRE